MRETANAEKGGRSTARWIALGFIIAFATSVFTVIYTGLNVEATRADFDVGFRSVTLVPGEQRSVELVFDSDASYAEATLEVTLPDVATFAVPRDYLDGRRPVAVAVGRNRYSLDIRALRPGSGYIVARVEAREPVGLERVFLTVSEQ